MTRILIETDKFQVVYGHYHCTLNYVRKSDGKAVRFASGKIFVKQQIFNHLQKDDEQLDEYISSLISFDNEALESQPIKGFNQ